LMQGIWASVRCKKLNTVLRSSLHLWIYLLVTGNISDIVRCGRRTVHRNRENSICAVRSESRCALIKGIGCNVHERLYRINWIKQLHTLPVLHFNRCLTTECSETTAHFNGNFDTDN
jgi:hypothetical protein